MTTARIKHFLRHCFRREFSFVQARLSPDGLFGLPFTMGAVVVVGATWLFGGISEDLISGDPLIQIDAFISEWFRSHATPGFSASMNLASVLASTATVSILAALVAGVLLWKRLWYWLLGLVLAVAGGMLLNVLLKNLFGRARPGWADPLMALTDPSFPQRAHNDGNDYLWLHGRLSDITNRVLAVSISHRDVNGFSRVFGRTKQDVPRGALLERCVGGDGSRNSLACALPYVHGNIASPPRQSVVC